MTTSPSEPVDNPHVSGNTEPASGDGSSQDDILSDGIDRADDAVDQDSEPTSTAPAENNLTVPDPPG